MLRVTVDDLARWPVERLARLLMELAVEDRTLLVRLHETMVAVDPAPATADAAEALNIVAPGGALSSATPAGALNGFSPRDGGAPNGVAHDTPRPIVGQSKAIRQVLEQLERFASTDEPILITGESGTGKELVAHAVHNHSSRRHGPFVAVNCAAIPGTLVASELFGHEKGAFTGATGRSRGQIEHAHGGTLFLDEIGDMPIDMQPHLLRFLQERRIMRVGGREQIDVDVRIVAATNVDLPRAIGEGRFREDLYYRLNMLALEIPPLRDRPDDIPVLAKTFLREAAARFKRPVDGFAPEGLAALQAHDWPGNVRELIAVVRRAVIVSDVPLIGPENLMGLRDAAERTDIAPRNGPSPPVFAPAQPVGRPVPGSDEERAMLLDTLRGTQENVTQTAKELGVSRVTLYRMLRRHDIMLGRGLRAPPVVG
jgi:DNA-binding NtrC family response regulator